jgi:preprotein translocase subunit SecY
MIIFTGIAAGIPAGALQLFELVKTGELRVILAAVLLAFMLLVIAAVIFMEVAQRRIAIQYSQRLANNNMGSLAQSHLPIKNKKGTGDFNFNIAIGQWKPSTILHPIKIVSS